MSNYFVDSTTGNDLDNGSTMDLAWATLKHAIEAGSLVPGDWVWIRRIHVEYAGDPTSDIQMLYDGTPVAPIHFIGWPRNTHAVSSSDWTNGSTAVVIDDADMDREQHQGRWLTAPDGEDYLITKVTDASNIVIDRKYVGDTTANAVATIKADEDYTTAQAIDDSAWTIKKADYNADADDVPCIDFKGTAYQIYLNSAMHLHWANIEFRDSADLNGIINQKFSKLTYYNGCLFHSDVENSTCLMTQCCTLTVVDRCIVEGDGVNARWGIDGAVGGAFIIKNSAIYGFAIGLYSHTIPWIRLENVNLGVEIANTIDIQLADSGKIYGRDVAIPNELFGYNYASQSEVSIENFGKVLGVHKRWNGQGTITKQTADGTGDLPNARPDGAANVLEILYDLVSTITQMPAPWLADWACDVLVHTFEALASSKTYRYYVQSMDDLLASELWLELEYVKTYDGTDKYTVVTVKSDETIAARSDNNDWTQYIEVPNIQPAVGSKVRIRCKCAYEHASNKIFIDPNVEIQ